MDETTQQYIDGLIRFIETTEEPASVTNEIVAAVLEHLNTKCQTASGNAAEAKAAVADLREELDRMFGGEDVPEVIDNLGDVVKFLIGYKDNERLRDILNGLSKTDRSLGEDIAALKEAVWPLEVRFEASPAIIEVGSAAYIATSWSVKRNGEDLLAKAAVKWSLADETVDIDTGEPARWVMLNNVVLGSYDFVIEVECDGMKKSASARVTAVYPSYFGIINADSAVTPEVISSMSKSLLTSRRVTRNGISLSNQRVCFAYPKSYGTLSSVKDGNNFETLTAYTRSIITMSSVEYYVYVMAEPVTAAGVTQVYS